MDRRGFLRGAALAGAAAWAGGAGDTAIAAPAGPRILDTHIHLFDPARPGGVPWPEPSDLIYRPALPPRYESLAAPLGIVGAIAIEASPLPGDNDWLLGVVRASPVMVGMIGDLPPGTPTFAAELDRLRRNPLFLGVRHGNLWGRSLAADLARPETWTSLEQLARAQLVLETANPDLPLLQAALRVATRFPTLTVVIDHLPHMEEPASAAERGYVASCLEHLAAAPRVFIKLSEIPRLQNGRLIEDASLYRDRLDRLWSLFGPDRVMFGSDWPNSDHVAPLDRTLGIVRSYMAGKTPQDRDRYFFANSQRAYRWRPRRPDQA